VSNPHTDNDTVVAQAIFDLIEANKVDLALDDVLWGNQEMIPRASAAIVIPLGKRRVLAGVTAPGGRTENTLLVTIEISRSKVGTEAVERKAVDDTGTAIELLIHSDTTLGGIVIHGFVEQTDRGEVTITSGQYRTVRLMYAARTKTYLSVPTA
jgi:hypothetical protein